MEEAHGQVDGKAAFEEGLVSQEEEGPLQDVVSAQDLRTFHHCWEGIWVLRQGSRA